MQYNNIYKLNFARLAVLLLPSILRKPVFTSFLRAMYAQLDFSSFADFRENKNYRLTHNGQVCYLRKMLNDRFDPNVGERPEDKRRRIEIGDGEEMQPTFVYWREKQQFVGVPIRDNSALVVSWRGTVASGGYDFTVRVPQEVYDDTEKMAIMPPLIYEYKLASKQFSIVKNSTNP